MNTNHKMNQYPSDLDLRKATHNSDRSQDASGEATTDVSPSDTQSNARLSKEAVAKACSILDGFIGAPQVAALMRCCRGEEKHYFFHKLIEMAEIVSNMPKTYDQDGKGDNAVAYLHYFADEADWYITEKDTGCETDGPEHFQMQAFGLADPHRDGGELGYISIPEILSCGAELDFYFEPKTLREIRSKKVRSDLTSGL